jgi:phospholipase C
MHASRRKLLGVAGAAAAVALGADRFGATLLSSASATDVPLPPPDASGIEHVVVVMMENRSFDHLLGWLPGADGKQAGLSYVDRYGISHATHHMTVPNNCGFYDPDHSYEGGRIQYDGGRCDGFLRSGQNDISAIGYYEQADLPFLGQAATQWTTFDRYFSAVMAETYPNRFYMHAAQTDRLHNNYSPFQHATIWDRLKAAGVSGTYYYSDIPFAALLGSHTPASSLPVVPNDKFTTSFIADAAAGMLPAVSFVDPQFLNEDTGLSNDDHPHADLRAGEAFLNKIYDAVRTSPNWDKTVMVITFDEWGGFFDHVRPTAAPDVSAKTALRGFRVPTILISPMARRGYVSHDVYDHTSILRMIEWRWGLKPLTPRDAAARNIAETLDFSQHLVDAPVFAVPDFTPVACTASNEGTTADSAEKRAEAAEWPALRKMALSHGWTLPS